MEPGATDQIILMMISGLPADTIKHAAIAKLGIGPRKVDRVIEECKAKITLAADYDRAAELGTAIARLNDCYSKAAAIQDVKTCVATQRELNKLLGLYFTRVEDRPAAGPSQSEAEVRAHLAPLFTDGDTMPIEELARQAAQRIVSA